jgi:RNA polymerase sigma factor (sigma-70 family)
MAYDALTPPAVGGTYFSPDFVAHLAIYQKAIRGHRVAGWARERGLLDDLVQLALIDLARVESRFDPGRATSHHHYRMAVLRSRVYDCFDFLKRMHGDAMDHRGDDVEDLADDGGAEVSTNEASIGDEVLANATLAELVSELADCLKGLPSVQRRVLELALDEYTDREIADHLGVSTQAVHTTRKKGLAKLRATLHSSHCIN